MEIFGPAAWYESPGRGWVAVIAGVAPYDPEPLIGQMVNLGGTSYLVTGIENPVMDNPPEFLFGLVVALPGEAS